MLEGCTGLETKESFENCVVMSMKRDTNINYLEGLELPQLEAFLLSPNGVYGQSSSLSEDNFFQGMPNLKVLDISRISDHFASSIRNLKNLITLHLEGCYLRDEVIPMICNLEKLQVLSLRGSTFGTLPDEIENLTNLRVLDLTGCLLDTFPVDGVAKLNRLRELYLLFGWNKLPPWGTDDMIKLGTLSLEGFEIKINIADVSLGSIKFSKMQRFRIFYTSPYRYGSDLTSYSRALLINGENGRLELSSLRDLLWKADYLCVEEVRDVEYLVDGTNLSIKQQQEMFQKLQVLTLKELPNLKSICRLQPDKGFESMQSEASNTREDFQITPHRGLQMKFPSLKKMHVERLDRIPNMWDLLGFEKTSWKSYCFENLKEVAIYFCSDLLSVFTSGMVNSLLQLEKLVVNRCRSLKEVITSSEDEDDNDINPATTTIIFPKLHTLKLERLHTLEYFYRGNLGLEFPKLRELSLNYLLKMKALSLPNTESLPTQVTPTVLFHGIDFESLEILKLGGIVSFGGELFVDYEKPNDDRQQLEDKLFSSLRRLELRYLSVLKKIPWRKLQNLRSLIIRGINEAGITALISTTLPVGGGVVLPLLQQIMVDNCEGLKAIVEIRDGEEDRECVQNGITLFPSLTSIYLYDLWKLECFSIAKYEAHFPSLETVIVRECSSMQSFSMGGSLTTPKLKEVQLDHKDMILTDRLNELNDLVAQAHDAKATSQIRIGAQIFKGSRLKEPMKAKAWGVAFGDTEEWGNTITASTEGSEPRFQMFEGGLI